MTDEDFWPDVKVVLEKSENSDCNILLNYLVLFQKALQNLKKVVYHLEVIL